MLPPVATAIIAGSPDAVLVLDMDGRYQEANAAACHLLGYSREELLQLHRADVIPEGAPWLAEAQATYRAEGRWRGEIDLVRKDGTLVPVEAWSVLIPGPDGALGVSFLRDLTGQKRAESANARLAALVQSSADAIMSLSLEGRIIEWNPAAERLYGYTTKDVVGQPVAVLTPPELAHEIDHFLARVSSGETITGVEMVRRTKDGRLIDVALTVTPVRNAAGEVVASSGIIRDITDQKQQEATLRQSEERFRTAFEHAPIGMTLVGLDGHYLQVNSAMCALTGYTAAELLARRFQDITHPDDLAPELAQAARLLTGEIRVFQWEKRYLRKDGEVVWVRVNSSLVRDESGAPHHFIGQIEDITARKAAETALQEAESRYRTLVEHLPVVVALNATDATQSTLYISPRSEALFGYTPDEYLADPTLWMQTVHPDDRERILAELAGMNVTGEVFQDEYRMLARDGRVVWVLEESTLVRDDAGRPLHWLTVQTDVTARRQAEDELRQSEERFRTAFDSAAIGMDLVSLDGHFLQVNAALCALTGYTEAELLTRSFQEISHPDDLPADLEQAQHLIAGESRSYQMEKRYIHKSGQVIWGHLSAALVRDEQGAPLHFIRQIEDITARKQAEAALKEAEAKYRSLVEQLPAVVYLTANDEHYTPLFYNSYITTMTGETPEEAMVRPGHWLAQVHPEDRERVAAADARAASMGGVFQAEYRRFRRDGSEIWVRNEAAPLRDETGQIIAWQGVLLDISNGKQAEEDLRAALNAAQAANRTKGIFLDMMSHELRTPLQAVLGYSEALLMAPQGSLTDEQREDLGYIYQGGGRMLTLINQVLDLSRMEAGGIDLMIKPFDLGQVIEAVRQDVAPQAAAKGLAVEIELPPSLPRVTGDAERVRQIVLNLAGNAVKFTDAGLVRITATAMGTGGMEVVVSDTGMGIPAEALPHIFEAFQQVESGLTRRHQGSGLGLAIAWKLAEQMGGTIAVNSEPGVGSTFTFHLPGAP